MMLKTEVHIIMLLQLTTETETKVNLVLKKFFDTPRPEGFNQSIFEYNEFPNSSGYSFKNYLVVPYNSNDADFFLKSTIINFT
jgi:hypothetical protein